MATELIPLAIVLTSFDAGGTERQMIELIRRLDRSRFSVHVVCFRKHGAWMSRVEEAAREVREFRLRSLKSLSTLAALRDLASWLRARRIQVVHTCDRYANIFALPGAALARVPVRIGSRRELAPPDQSRAHAVAQRLAYRVAHRIIANSEAAAARLREEHVPSSRISVVPNGVELSAFSAHKGRGQRPMTITTVANMREGKGHDVLLHAAAIVLQHQPNVRFRLVGDGRLREPLANLAAELGIASSVDFLGHREDVPALLAETDLYAFPSLTEAFPNGLIEGMAAGLPVIASGVGGMLELVEDRRNGWLVPPGDAPALASAIIELLRQPLLADRLGRAARHTIEARYSFNRMVTAFEQLYLSELAARRSDIPAHLKVGVYAP